jgi:uncharacterized repeat protein (TIGR03803 family)
MNTHVRKLLLLRALIAGLCLTLTGRVTAQTLTTLHSFTNNPDGAHPSAGLILSGTTLYGTATGGGTNGQGTVFAISANGTGYTNLYRFTGGSDGAEPNAGLILSGNTLYGTATGGGTNGTGALFAVNTNGSNFTTLYSFTATYTNSSGVYTNSDGAYPYAGLILSGNILYGTATMGGTNGYGTVFALNTNGSNFTTLHNFTALFGPNSTNGDGNTPYAELILSGNTLYGTATKGGTNGYGTVFALNTNGMGYTNLYSFTGGNDGAYPYAGLILSGNTLYGTVLAGGSNSLGTVFALNTNGMGFTNLHTFTGYPNDGAEPYVGLILSGSILYGTAQYGGTNSDGTVFAINTNGMGYTNVYSFTGGTNGAYPYAGLILSGNTLYGTAYGGGSSNLGTVFGLSLPLPQLTIILSGTNVILTWPTNGDDFSYAGFTLQSTTDLVSQAIWTAVSPPPAVVNGQNTVTNPISGTQHFYRLSQ